jgi:hypothetical protein
MSKNITGAATNTSIILDSCELLPSAIVELVRMKKAHAITRSKHICAFNTVAASSFLEKILELSMFLMYTAMHIDEIEGRQTKHIWRSKRVFCLPKGTI